ncbi:DUF1680 family protein [Parabacteroides sp. PFB2-12]|uniref:glycoside hydrolase family 127 protein n=1 Tax=unclassified Parabacteroides TaxID=2649774 RepID=UPI00247421A3|nr:MULTISPECIES: beta-L-arabinofuranosidase domain-containing protein [unclassified Parabacteroides]MDH6341842.1 DUF1680 family protein [Parabacteroides sp. PM6-13]MDH6391619.1 DUF1680 family protein [Parabacteroides sp. PFB2-12]
MKQSLILSWALALVTLCAFTQCESTQSDAGGNMAVMATATISRPDMTANGQPIASLNDGMTNIETGPTRMRQGQTMPPLQNQWVEYEWTQPVKTSEIEVFWWNWDGTITLPEAYRISYWDGTEYVPVKNAEGLGLTVAEYNKTTFDEVETTKLRLEANQAQQLRATLQEWKVIQSPNSQNLPPIVKTNGDRTVMRGGTTYLTAHVTAVSPVEKTTWTKVSGPGTVTFTDNEKLDATAVFSEVGEYILAFTAKKGKDKVTTNLQVTVSEPPAEGRLDVVYTKNYSIDSPLWDDRAKAMIVNWIPWCIDQCENSNLATGGLDNFIEAAKALNGKPYAAHKGYVFANAWVHQTIESICIALMIDPKGDKEIIAAQEKMKKTLEKWIPIILAAQEPDGYLQTAYTLRDPERWEKRWEDRNRSAHEGYVSGYFIESAINHHTLTNGTDLRLYNAAKKLADCWADNIGPNPGQIVWWDEHQEMEQALVRFGRFVNDMEGNGKGDRYIALAKFLMDSRMGGNEYSQSHVPVQQQYEAVGHAVRAVYLYSAMSDIAAETQDPDYQSAVMSLWDNMVNKKYYVTGGVGSGETSEGFGPNYSLRHNAYCESCSSCALIFFQHKLNLAYHDAKYADLYEETMYNALLGSLDMEAKKFYYPNPLHSVTERTPWHGCPCCVGNIPRTLLMIPTWTYVTSEKGLYVNLFVGSTINVERVVGTDVEMVQKTNYPWDGNVAITVNPKEEKEFTLFVRVPDRKTSELYDSEPALSGLLSLSVNGQAVTPTINKGYAEITRKWNKGDKVEFVLPMEVQKITADEKIEATRDQVALRYGPMIYNFEEVDNGAHINEGHLGTGALKAEWDPNFYNGMMLIKGTWADGKPMVAIPNFARMNRNEPRDPQIRTSRSNVWVKK